MELSHPKKYLNESICDMFAVSFQRQDPKRIPVKIEASNLESNESRKPKVVIQASPKESVSCQ